MQKEGDAAGRLGFQHSRKKLKPTRRCGDKSPQLWVGYLVVRR